MKKMKLIGVAAAALLAVAPVLSTTSIHAAVAYTPSTTSKTPTATVPMVTYNGVTYTQSANITLANNESFNYAPVGSTVDVVAMQKAFQVPAGDSITIDTSSVDTSVAAIYPVTAKIANNATGQSFTITFNLTVGSRGANYQTIQGTTDSSAPVYEEQNGDVAETGHALQLGTQVATYGEVTINGKKYTRLNSPTSNKFILSGWFDGQYADEGDTSTKYLMHAALIYNKDLTKSGKKFRQFRNIDVYSDPVTMSDGKKYYRLVDTWYYVKANNIDGTPRKLIRNSYVYKSSKTKASKKLLKKGSTITTYGSIFYFGGKTYYRIGKGKQYVRAVNFEM